MKRTNIINGDEYHQIPVNEDFYEEEEESASSSSGHAMGGAASPSSSSSQSNNNFKQHELTKTLASQNRYDLRLFIRLIHIIKLLYSSPIIPGIMVLFLLGLAISQTYASSLTGKLLANVYTYLADGDTHSLLRSLLFGLFSLTLSALLDSTIKFTVGIIAWRWRKTLCLTIQNQYFDNNLFYRIMAFDTRIDNPDQRITSDIDNFTTLMANVLSQMITGPLVVGYYTFLTWRGMGWYAPAIIYGFFILGYIANKFIMSPLVSVSYLQDKLEGDFRYLHLRIRTFAESIALQSLTRDPTVSQTMVEEEQAKQQFDVLLENKKKQICWQYGLNTTSDLFTYLSPLVNYLIIAIPLFIGTKKTIPFADVSVFSYNCIMLASGFSQYINVTANISDLSSYIQRISTMLEVCNQVKQQKYEAQQKQENDIVSSTEVQKQVGELKVEPSTLEILLKEVSYFTPKGESLFKNISLLIERGSSLLIMGPSGSGKSSLIRIINGLWPFFYGKIIKPANEQMFFLSQQPYLIYGSLEEQILYPYTIASKRISKQQMRELFERFDLGYLLDRERDIIARGDLNDLTHNWLNALSPGEQQLISFLRLLYHKPVFALMDESTSSIPQSMEKRVYQACKDQGISTISVGHRHSLTQYHQKLLTLDKQHNWKLQNIDNSSNNNDNNKLIETDSNNNNNNQQSSLI
ncbi:ABC transporter D family protein [Heterostelium album PN500]|uniref:ABC transporter D family protein n=1 Tax=Heterostelium pallidum (strain ATCC 26659 / Pp 5 / PN500) TaxID=670386 RepID=D3AXW2_HETP5|nr:ABC transporter D family protein [Heterostelium album PN500]EFA85789.1 ABC transporter D family protein [Heterostelium album PN500]|eukprot:XP_020437895.1 ABC transporter D family protein [Heterostelium album PN500]